MNVTSVIWPLILAFIGALMGCAYPFIVLHATSQPGIARGFLSATLILFAMLASYGINRYLSTTNGFWLFGLYLPSSIAALIRAEIKLESRANIRVIEAENKQDQNHQK